MNSEHLAQQGANRTCNRFCSCFSKSRNLEVVLAVLAPLKLKEDPLLEGSKALGADEAPEIVCLADNLKRKNKAPGMEKVSIRVDRLPIFVESLLAVVAIARRVPWRFCWCS